MLAIQVLQNAACVSEKSSFSFDYSWSQTYFSEKQEVNEGDHVEFT